MVAGLVLLVVGVLVHFGGSGIIHKVLPPAVTGAVVMLIGFNLAPVVAGIYWPQDQWVALLTMTFMVCARCCCPASGPDRGVPRADLRLPALLGVRRDLRRDQLRSGRCGRGGRPRPGQLGPRSRRPTGSASRRTQDGLSATWPRGVGRRLHGPSFSLTFILLVLPGVIALIAENTGHVKAVAEMTGDDLDPYMGRAIGADGFATALARRSAARRRRRTPRTSASWVPPGSTRPRPTTSPVRWRSCSACARSSAPSSTRLRRRRLGGITVVLYGMIGLVGAKIWVENGVDFGNP